MAYLNGRLPSAALSPISGGMLRHDAARAWNDMREFIGEKHGVWIAPTGSRSSYRTYAEQQYFWNLYQNGGNLAAYPGTSNHGWGVAVDVASEQMVYYIKQYGAQFGWKKTEAFGEWWHYNYVGGYKPKPELDPRRFNTKAEKFAMNRYEYHNEKAKRQLESGPGPKYRQQIEYRDRYKRWLNRRANLLYRRGKASGDFKKYHRGHRRFIIRKVLT